MEAEAALSRGMEAEYTQTLSWWDGVPHFHGSEDLRQACSALAKVELFPLVQLGSSECAGIAVWFELSEVSPHPSLHVAARAVTELNLGNDPQKLPPMQGVEWKGWRHRLRCRGPAEATTHEVADWVKQNACVKRMDFLPCFEKGIVPEFLGVLF
jgi:hypothetical protein